MDTMNDLRKDPDFKACIDRIFHRYPVKLAYLYGSVAAGNATPLSDVDIALVVVNDVIELGKQLEMELDLMDVISRHCGTEVDVRIINNAPIMLRGEVVTNGILLYSIDEDFRVEFETSTRSVYFDYMPVAAMLRRALSDRLHERGING